MSKIFKIKHLVTHESVLGYLRGAQEVQRTLSLVRTSQQHVCADVCWRTFWFREDAADQIYLYFRKHPCIHGHSHAAASRTQFNIRQEYNAFKVSGRYVLVTPSLSLL